MNFGDEAKTEQDEQDDDVANDGNDEDSSSHVSSLCTTDLCATERPLSKPITTTTTPHHTGMHLSAGPVAGR